MDKLDAIARREFWPLNGAEKARLTAALTVGVMKEARGTSSATEGAAVERIWAEAEERVSREYAARAQQEELRQAEKAEKAARRWWR